MFISKSFVSYYFCKFCSYYKTLHVWLWKFLAVPKLPTPPPPQPPPPPSLIIPCPEVVVKNKLTGETTTMSLVIYIINVNYFLLENGHCLWRSKTLHRMPRYLQQNSGPVNILRAQRHGNLQTPGTPQRQDLRRRGCRRQQYRHGLVRRRSKVRSYGDQWFFSPVWDHHMPWCL